MPKLQCKCGNIIDLSTVPNPAGFELVWEPSKEELTAQLVAIHERASSAAEFERGVSGLLIPNRYPLPYVYECNSCGRLAVMRHPSDIKVTLWYAPDTLNESRSRLASLFDATT